MSAGLIDVLNGRFLNGMQISEVDEDLRHMVSISDNLKQIFNTRQGSVLNLPDYGLPDIYEIYRRLPDSLEELRFFVRDVVHKFEPRLGQIRIEDQPPEPNSRLLAFVLSGELMNRQTVSFQVLFIPNGIVKVRVLVG